MLALLWMLSGCAGLPTTPAAPPAPPTSAQGAGGTTIVAIAPPMGPKGTIWDFLGVKELCKDLAMVADCGMNFLGNQFPGLASGLPMSSLSNPANLNSPNPAIAAAAGAKAEENAAPQKAAALKYLGTLGCGGCYPDVEKALLAGMDDCTESVRFAAVSALAETSRIQCRYCMANRCCSTNVRNKLVKIATDVDDNGCYVEPSARVRRMARVALCNCTCDPIDALPHPLPAEGPSSEDAVPPVPNPTVKVHQPPHRRQQVAANRAPGANFDGGGSSHPHRSAEGNSSAGQIAQSKTPIEKRYDDSHKPSDIVVKTSGAKSPPPAVVVDTDTASRRRDQDGPRIRWERAAVSIYRFETKEEALEAMDSIRRKAMGEEQDTPAVLNLKYVIPRQVGWTRPQDIKSPELAKILFDLPVGQVSPVIEVGDTLLVCRVLEKDPPDANSHERHEAEVNNANGEK